MDEKRLERIEAEFVGSSGYYVVAELIAEVRRLRGKVIGYHKDHEKDLAEVVAEERAAILKTLRLLHKEHAPTLRHAAGMADCIAAVEARGPSKSSIDDLKPPRADDLDHVADPAAGSPLTPEQAQWEYDHAEPIPLSKERIEEIVRFATNPAAPVIPDYLNPEVGDPRCPKCGYYVTASQRADCPHCRRERVEAGQDHLQ